ncbi:MAG: hypothetical protein ABIE74_00995 [Pseudomonadota bacterium]
MKLDNYILCDDIRNELHNKFSLMGLYADRLIIKVPKALEVKWPKPLRLAIYLRLIFNENDERPDSFCFTFQILGQKLKSIIGKVIMDEGKTMLNISLIAEGLPISPGKLGFELTLKKANKEIYSERVEQALIIVEEKVG